MLDTLKFVERIQIADQLNVSLLFLELFFPFQQLVFIVPNRIHIGGVRYRRRSSWELIPFHMHLHCILTDGLNCNQVESNDLRNDEWARVTLL